MDNIRHDMNECVSEEEEAEKKKMKENTYKYYCIQTPDLESYKYSWTRETNKKMMMKKNKQSQRRH